MKLWILVIVYTTYAGVVVISGRVIRIWS